MSFCGRSTETIWIWKDQSDWICVPCRLKVQAMLRSCNKLWLTLSWCSTDKAKIYNHFYINTRWNEVTKNRFINFNNIYKEYIGRVTNYMHIITPPWMEGQHTICTSPSTLCFMHILMSFLMPRLWRWCVCLWAGLIKTEREWTSLVVPWQLLLHSCKHLQV